MRRLITATATALFCTLVLNVSAQQKPKMAANKMVSKEALPYQPTYSSQFSFGNPAYSNSVLKAWNTFDDNTLEMISDMMADTVNLFGADGEVIKGQGEVMKAIKSYRNGFKEMKSDVAAWTTLKSPDRPGTEVVLIWGTENGIKTDGSTHKLHLHEAWFFDKDGKVGSIRQYIMMAPKESK